MSPSSPFVDEDTGTLDIGRILFEAVPIATLIALFGVVAYLPFAFLFIVGPSPVGALLTLLSRFVLAVGAGVVLLYVVTRAIQLAEE